MFNFAFMSDVGMGWICTPCLNAFWHGRPYILLQMFLLSCLCGFFCTSISFCVHVTKSSKVKLGLILSRKVLDYIRVACCGE